MDPSGGGSPKLKYLDATGNWSVPVIGTLAADLPVGTPGNDTLVKLLTFWGEPIVWRVIGHNLSGMPDGSLTLLSDQVLAFICFDARHSNQTNSLGGSSDYKTSNIRQWMNSDAEAGKWYKSQVSYDEPPDEDHVDHGTNPYANWAGFLHDAKSEEKELLLDTTRDSSLIDKMFLLSIYETVGSNQPKVPVDGTPSLAYFRESRSSLNVLASEQCKAHDNTSYTSHYNYNGFVGKCLTSSIGYATSASSREKSVACYGESSKDLFVTAENANVVSGFRPACNIPDTIRLTQGDDGTYTILTD